MSINEVNMIAYVSYTGQFFSDKISFKVHEMHSYDPLALILHSRSIGITDHNRKTRQILLKASEGEIYKMEQFGELLQIFMFQVNHGRGGNTYLQDHHMCNV